MGKNINFMGENIKFMGKKIKFMGENIKFMGENIKFMGENIKWERKNSSNLASLMLDKLLHGADKLVVDVVELLEAVDDGQKLILLHLGQVKGYIYSTGTCMYIVQ